MVADRREEWLFERAVRRAGAVDGLVADDAVAICGRPVRRREVRTSPVPGVLGQVTWSIDADVVVELTAVATGKHEVAVYDVGLLRPLGRSLRSRHLLVSYRSRDVRA